LKKVLGSQVNERGEAVLDNEQCLYHVSKHGKYIVVQVQIFSRKVYRGMGRNNGIGM
jgi:hypothetical protein